MAGSFVWTFKNISNVGSILIDSVYEKTEIKHQDHITLEDTAVEYISLKG